MAQKDSFGVRRPAKVLLLAAVCLAIVSLPMWPFSFGGVDWAALAGMETIVAAIIAVGGYVLDAYHSRLQERRSLQARLTSHVSIHSTCCHNMYSIKHRPPPLLLRQVERAQRQMSELLVPTNVQVTALVFSVINFIQRHTPAVAAQASLRGKRCPELTLDWTTDEKVFTNFACGWAYAFKDGLFKRAGGGPVNVYMFQFCYNRHTLQATVSSFWPTVLANRAGQCLDQPFAGQCRRSSWP